MGKNLAVVLSLFVVLAGCAIPPETKDQANLADQKGRDVLLSSCESIGLRPDFFTGRCILPEIIILKKPRPKPKKEKNPEEIHRGSLAVRESPTERTPAEEVSSKRQSPSVSHLLQARSFHQ